MKKFTELNLCPQLQDTLARHGFVEPTPVQAQSIPVALEGNDLVATAQTGTGKTLAFVLPILERLMANPGQRGIRALVLTPTRELAIQINEVFSLLSERTGIRSAVVVGGLSENTQLNAIRRGADVVIATPGRLADYLKRRLVKLGNAGYLVFDEADRMLDMGFLPTIRQITAELPRERQTLFFSATIDPSVKHLIDSHLNRPVRVAIGSVTKPSDQIDLDVYEVEQNRKLGLLQFMLRQQQGSFLVFARTKHGADRLARKLGRIGVKAARIHGDRTQSQRNHALKGFQEGQYRVLVATDVAARGIHVEGIAHVVNYDLPQAPGDFIHRVGRTGRAGTRGTASTFGMRSERSEIRAIERTLKVQLNRRAVSADVAPEDQLEYIVPIASHRPQQAAKRPERRPGTHGFASGGNMRAFGESRKQRPSAGRVKSRGSSGQARRRAS